MAKNLIPLLDAYAQAQRQREISVSEFFTKNRHLLGFDNPKRALLTAVREAVDNSLDACEEAGILPEIYVATKDLGNDRFTVSVLDNGPGIVKTQIPKIFGKLLYGSKFHSLKMSRGQQGIGISAAGMYGQLTTGKPIKITSRIGSQKPAHHYHIQINTQKNLPEILRDVEITWDKARGTLVEMEIEAKYQKGRQSPDEYLKQTAIANPHANIIYEAPDGEKITYDRASNTMPSRTNEIKPHPYGVELGILIKMLKSTKAKKLRSFLLTEFSRVGGTVANNICREAGLEPNSHPTTIAHNDADRLYQAIKKVKIMSPPTDCISPIGEKEIVNGLKKEIKADFYAATTRAPAVYRGNPFLIEAGLAYGGDLPQDDLIQLYRFANRVPLLYQQAACAMFKATQSLDWKNYGLQQNKGALPTGPVIGMIHIASVWVPFTSESKEAVAGYPEILKEMKLALQDTGRKLSIFLSRKRRVDEEERKRSYIEKYIPHICIGLQQIGKFPDSEKAKIHKILTETLNKSRIKNV